MADELTRDERIDRLADWKLKRRGEDRAATEVWDEAADEIDKRDRRRFLATLRDERELWTE